MAPKRSGQKQSKWWGGLRQGGCGGSGIACGLGLWLYPDYPDCLLAPSLAHHPLARSHTHTGCAQAMLGDFVIRRKTLEDEYTAAQAELAAHQVKAQAAEEDLVKFKKQVCSSPPRSMSVPPPHTPNSTRGGVLSHAAAAIVCGSVCAHVCGVGADRGNGGWGGGRMRT